MKRLLYILFLVLIISSCTKDDLEYQNDFEKSYKTWQQFKLASKNSYIFKTTDASWTGVSTEYTFEVLDGVVISRSFVYKSLDNNTKRPENGWTEEIVINHLNLKGYTEEEINKLKNSGELLSTLEWKENKEELGTKKSSSNIWTLDQIYEKAKTEWLIKRPKAQIYFETDNNGLISWAGYVPDGCQDDCFNGIKIIKIEKLED